METVILYSTVYFTEMLFSYLFFSGVSERKRSPALCLLIGTGMFAISAVLNFAFSNELWLNSLSFIAVNAAYALLCFSVKPLISVFYSVALMAMCFACEYLTIIPLSLVRGSSVSEFDSSFPVLLTETVISKTLYMLSCWLLARIIGRKTVYAKVPVSFLVFPASTLFTAVSFGYVTVRNELETSTVLLLAVINLVQFASTVFLFVAYRRTAQKEMKQIQMQNELEKLHTQEIYYSMLREQNEKLMLFAHDSKKHLSAIKGLCDDPRVESYIEELNNGLSSYSRRLHSGNETVDVIISRYAFECGQLGISFTCDLTQSNLDFMRDSDLVALLGNLLENAVNAAKKADKKIVSVRTTSSEATDMITVKNTVAAPVRIADRMPVYKASGLHGLGLKSAKSIVDRYEGELTCVYDNDEELFIAYAYMRNNRPYRYGENGTEDNKASV